MGSVWCHAHKRMEEDTDYIDFPVSPTFLGAYYEQGLTQRRPFEAEQKPPTLLEESRVYTNNPIVNDDELWRRIDSQNKQIAELRAQIKELYSRPQNQQSRQREINPNPEGRVQRDIDVSSGD